MSGSFLATERSSSVRRLMVVIMRVDTDLNYLYGQFDQSQAA